MMSISIALLVISLDNTILNVALPSISRQLGATASELQWVVDAYVLVFASLLLTMGSLGDKLGRKRALQAGLTLFGIGSLWCALAPSTTALISPAPVRFGSFSLNWRTWPSSSMSTRP